MEIHNILRRFPRILLYSTLASGSALGYLHIVTREFFQIAQCQGDSMKPTLQSKYLILLQKLNRYNLKKGDIVAYRHPCQPEKLICKRVVHLPQEIIETPLFSGKIPKGCIWVEGENSAASSDSRHYGPVPMGLLFGKVIFVVWPFGINIHTKI